ncbi:hypothetical protein [Pseudolactococcus insecticola]|uniref:Conjugal transfer protein n=1 Tax=Pseudolactococcus insecticola TaxID=2709158 RepID=A0A6A0BAF4_9LACT|nr:hypothetical protein [Lactococcus insecticola]GFH40807.1 hypothetical protein Hs20B_12050 [Lactococcus insecticola]
MDFISKVPTLVSMANYDIFKMKPFIEPSSVENKIWGGLTFIFVELPFWILKLVAFIFYWLIKSIGNLSPYDTFKSAVFDTSKDLFDKIGGGSGNFSLTSIAGFFIMITLIYLVYAFMQGRNFTQKVVHVLAVYAVALIYFGSIGGTNGGIYILDTVHNVSKEVTTKLADVSVTNSDGKKTTSGAEGSFANTYLSNEVYDTYRFINTGSTDPDVKPSVKIDGDYPQLKLDDVSVGIVKDKDGEYKNKSDVSDYLNALGEGADEKDVPNEWVSAISDYIMPKMFYVVFKIVDAVIVGIPVLFIQLISVAVEFLVLLIMFMIPIGIMISFLPSMQNILFNMLKTSFGFLLLPSITSIALLVFFYFNSMIGNSFSNLSGDIKKEGVLVGGLVAIVSLAVTLIVEVLMYVGIWKFKGTIAGFILGNSAANALPVNNVNGKVLGKEGDIVTKAGQIAQVTSQTVAPVVSGASMVAGKATSGVAAVAGMGAGTLYRGGKALNAYTGLEDAPYQSNSLPDKDSESTNQVQEDLQDSDVDVAEPIEATETEPTEAPVLSESQAATDLVEPETASEPTEASVLSESQAASDSVEPETVSEPTEAPVLSESQAVTDSVEPETVSEPTEAPVLSESQAASDSVEPETVSEPTEAPVLSESQAATDSVDPETVSEPTEAPVLSESQAATDSVDPETVSEPTEAPVLSESQAATDLVDPETVSEPTEAPVLSNSRAVTDLVEPETVSEPTEAPVLSESQAATDLVDPETVSEPTEAPVLSESQAATDLVDPETVSEPTEAPKDADYYLSNKPKIKEKVVTVAKTPLTKTAQLIKDTASKKLNVNQPITVAAAQEHVERLSDDKNIYKTPKQGNAFTRGFNRTGMNKRAKVETNLAQKAEMEKFLTDLNSSRDVSLDSDDI